MLYFFFYQRRRNSWLLLAYALLGLLPLAAAAASVETVKLPNGFESTAEYRAGKPELPAVLVLHGFLSTYNFLTVSNLTNALGDAGYTVVAPNLSLGVNARAVSLACEAIHTHALSDDTAEINFWIEWLTRRGHKHVVLVGHSFGSLQELSYTLEYKSSAVKKLIAISLLDMDSEIGEPTAQAQIKQAQALVAKRDNGLREYQVSYCKKYVAPPTAFLSYATWSKKRILHAISRTPVPVEVILGGNDSRMAAGWPELLQKNGVHVLTVPGANHFFSNEQEFDLLDSVLASLRTVR